MLPITLPNQDEGEGLQMRREVDDGVLEVRQKKLSEADAPLSFVARMLSYPSPTQDEREGLQMRRKVDDGVLLVRRGNFTKQMLPYHSSSNTTFYAGTHNPLVNLKEYP